MRWICETKKKITSARTALIELVTITSQHVDSNGKLNLLQVKGI
jgi:hypothetical protein